MKNQRIAPSKLATEAISAILWRRVQEGGFILLSALAIFLLVALVTYHESDPGWSHTATHTEIRNAAGQAGAWFADLNLYLFGYIAYMFPALIAYGSLRVFQNRKLTGGFHRLLWSIRVIGFVIAVAAGCALASLHFNLLNKGMPVSAGGVCGQLLSEEITPVLGYLGGTLSLLALFLAGITLATGLSWFGLMDIFSKNLWVKLGSWREKFLDETTFFKKWFTRNHTAKPALVPEPPRQSWLKRLKSFFRGRHPNASEYMKIEPILQNNFRTVRGNDVKLLEPKWSAVRHPNDFKETREVREVKERGIREFKTRPRPLQKGSESITNTALPSVNLLEPADPNNRVISYSPSKLEALSREVETRLQEFGVQVNVVAVYPGPVITRFELELAPGIKVSKISGLAKDLARALSVNCVRIVEVIPGKSVVGLEIPNEHRELVCLREMVESTQYRSSTSALSLALGKDIAGEPVVVNLGKMPHLLVAGTTGSGKSVGINAMLLSLLYKATPLDVRLILIDPKMLELSIYDGIPHLLTPVVTDMKDAANALRWCVAEMERRYQIMAALGVRNVAGYNHKIIEAELAKQPILDPLFKPERGGEQQTLQCLPYIVVIIDEFADMIMVVGKKVEELIARIAQKARAAGIHLILATQRPSVDVITGLIKANVPTRIAYQVSSRIDSRTILDQQGAEQLLGHGDMLYLAPGTGVPVRIHGAFVSDEEVHAVVKALKQSGEPDYAIDVLGHSSAQFTGGLSGFEEEGDGELDDLYDTAVQIVTETRRASISHLQRRLKIGYNRAARLIETMEAAGIVSNMQHNGGRDVLVGDTND